MKIKKGQKHNNREVEVVTRRLGCPKKKKVTSSPPHVPNADMTEAIAEKVKPTRTCRSKWSPSDLPLGIGQADYSIVGDLSTRTMNITLPQLLALSSRV